MPVATIVNPDLGRLDLIEPQTAQGSEDNVWQQPVSLCLDSAYDPWRSGDDMRRRFRQVMSDSERPRCQLSTTILPVIKRLAAVNSGTAPINEEALSRVSSRRLWKSRHPG